MVDHTTVSLKHCNKCGEDKPATTEFFSNDRREKSGLRHICKLCDAAKSAIWRTKNMDTVKTYAVAWRAANRDKAKATTAAYRAAHPERYAIWCAANRDKERAHAQRRRAAKRNLPATFTYTDWTRCLEYWGYCCAVCGRPQGLWHTLSQDHWIPLSRGGAYTAANIVPLCYGEGGCNNCKRDHNAHEWLMRTYGKRKAAQVERRIREYFEWVAALAVD